MNKLTLIAIPIAAMLTAMPSQVFAGKSSKWLKRAINNSESSERNSRNAEAQTREAERAENGGGVERSGRSSGGNAASILASMSDQDKMDFIKRGCARTPNGMAAIKGSDFDSGDEGITVISREDVLASVVDRSLVDGADMKAKVKHILKEDLDDSSMSVRMQKPSVWVQTIESIEDAKLKEEAAFELLNHVAHEESAKKRAACKKIYAMFSQEVLEKRLLAACGSPKEDLHGGFYASEHITDQIILKRLLVEDDKWARMKKKKGYIHSQRIAKAYRQLVANVTDNDVLWHLYSKTKPTKTTNNISIELLGGLIKRISPDRKESLVEAARVRSAEAAKTNVVVKGFWLGMDLADFNLINDANGNPADYRYDGNGPYKISQLIFERDSRIKFLELGEDRAGLEQFATKYGKVPDGKDTTGNIKIEPILRMSHNINMDVTSNRQTKFEAESGWKYVDFIHSVQVDIEDGTGKLIIRRPLNEKMLNYSDNTEAQANAMAGVLFSDDSDDDDDDDDGDYETVD